MGNREDLLAGAKRCLFEKGYGHTTARDIAAAAGTSLASIGYHFGSTKALLNAALFQAVEEWGEKVDRALAADVDPGAKPIERFEVVWARLIESFGADRPLWATQLEMIVHAEREPEIREQIATAHVSGRLALAELFQNLDPVTDGNKARAAGSFYQALVGGVLMQWLIDPERAPSARDLTEGLRIVASGM